MERLYEWMLLRDLPPSYTSRTVWDLSRMPMELGVSVRGFGVGHAKAWLRRYRDASLETVAGWAKRIRMLTNRFEEEITNSYLKPFDATY